MAHTAELCKWVTKFKLDIAIVEISAISQSRERLRREMARTYAEIRRSIMGRLTSGGIRLSEFHPSEQRIVKQMIDRGHVCAIRLSSGDYLVTKE